MKDLNRNTLAVMFTDIAGFTSLMEKNETEAMEVLGRCNEALIKQIGSYSGLLVKVMGDGTLSTFKNPVGAVDCARCFQESIRDCEFAVRIGIHWGDVIQESNDVYGDTVNVASRLEELSPPGCICISREILNGCGAEYLPDVIPIGLHRLKGLGRLIEVYALKGTRFLPDIGSDDADEIRKPSDEDGVPSLAVIPFDNLGSEKDSFYAYGISTDLASDLSRAGSINIASLSDVTEVLEDESSRDEIASKLGVRYLVNGALWKEKNKFRISVELSDHIENRIIWVDSWEDDWYCLSAIKGKLAEGLLKALGIEPDVFPGITDIITEKTDAYELWLKGRHLCNVRSSEADLQMARKVLKRSIVLDPGLIQARVTLGGTYIDQGEYEEGTRILKEALDIAVRNDDSVGQLDALNYMGISLWRQSHLKEAKQTIEKVLSLSESISDRRGQARALNNLGLVEWSSGDFKKALSRFENSLGISDELSASALQSNTLCNIGLVKASLGDDEAALEYYRKALEIQSVIGNLHSQAHILINLGNCYFRNGSVEKALSIFQRSLSICRELGDKPGESKSLNNMGNIMVYTGVFDAAEKYYLEAREISKKQTDLSMEGIILSGMALLHLRRGDPGGSIPLFLDSLEICRETRDREGEGEILGCLGEAYLNLGRPAEADKVLRESLEIIEDIGSRNLRAYVEALHSNSILIMDMSRNAVIESLKMIDSSLHDFIYLNTKNHSETYRFLAYSYHLLKNGGFPDLISADQSQKAFEGMILSARKSLMNIADGIDDRLFRKAFMEEIPAHIEIVRISNELDVNMDDLPGKLSEAHGIGS